MPEQNKEMLSGLPMPRGEGRETSGTTNERVQHSSSLISSNELLSGGLKKL